MSDEYESVDEVEEVDDDEEGESDEEEVVVKKKRKDKKWKVRPVTANATDQYI
jgi:hypothetical protein